MYALNKYKFEGVGIGSSFIRLVRNSSFLFFSVYLLPGTVSSDLPNWLICGFSWGRVSPIIWCEVWGFDTEGSFLPLLCRYFSCLGPPVYAVCFITHAVHCGLFLSWVRNIKCFIQEKKYLFGVPCIRNTTPYGSSFPKNRVQDVYSVKFSVQD